MNISRRSFVRPVAVVVLAAGLAGCGVFAPTESADEIGASRAAEVSASDVVVDEAVSDDDDEDVVESESEPEPEPEPQATENSSLLAGAVPLDSNWSQPFYKHYVERESLESPPTVTPLIGLLPGSSQLRVSPAQLGPEFQELLTSPDVGSAAFVAQAALLGSTDLVNDGMLEPLASMAATTCSFCLYRLEAAYAVHDEQADLPGLWEITLEDGAEVQELSSAQHVLGKCTGEAKGLVMRIDGDPVMVDLPAEGRFLVEMIYSQGQWWVLEILGPAATAQPAGF